MSDAFLPGNGFSTFEAADKVLVGLSGGVDSAVCVNVLRQQGFEVQGAVIRFSPAHDKAVAEAQKAEADKLGCRFIATGHYARVEDRGDGVYTVCKAVSTARDQSYMLYRLGQDILSRLCLPLGEFEKEDVRQMARDAALPCADAPDSMEICFIPDGDYAAFIEGRGLAGKEGHFIAPDGADLGPHKGVLRYTLGQRKGLGLALGKPAFVKAIRENGDVALGWAGEEFFGGMRLSDVCTPDGAPLPAGHYEVKVRSAAAPVGCTFDGETLVRFDEPARAPAPGQSAVFYGGDAVVGGGFIAEALD